MSGNWSENKDKALKGEEQETLEENKKKKLLNSRS